jgi:uncharacterized membrane protein YfcA
MKKTIIASLFFIAVMSINMYAQPNPQKPPRPFKSGEQFGKTLNLSIGVGGYSGFFGYVGHAMPVLHINYEFSVAKNLTMAPFVSFYTYRNKYYWGNKDNPYRNYYYHETVIPIGVKGTYYFDQLLRANPKWDFYLAGSFGFAIVNSSWDNNYPGDRGYYHNAKPLFFDIHAGTEYHFNNRIGATLDLSSSVSSIGIAIH